MPDMVTLVMDGEFVGWGDDNVTELWELNGRTYTLDGRDIGIIGSRI